MSPTLHAIDVTLLPEQDTEDITHFLNRLPVICTNLHVLDVVIGEECSKEERLEGIGRMLSMLPTLQNVAIEISNARDITPLIEGLAQLPLLEGFRINDENDTISSFQ